MSLIGHDKLLTEMRRRYASGQLHHAQLFVGPAHVGKTRLALELAVHMQGLEDNVIARRHLMEGLDSDTLLYLDEGEILKIKEVRGMIERIGQSHQKPHLVVIIENLGRMKVETANALLKSLEEPGEGVQFFLTAHREEDILDTIRSRCQVNHVQTVPDAVLETACDGHIQTDELLRFAMGRPGKLKHLMEDPEYLAAHVHMHRELSAFLEAPTVPAAFKLSQNYEKHDLLAEMLDILLHRARTLALSPQRPASLSHLDFTSVVEEVEDAKVDIQSNVNKRLVLENLLLPFAP